MWETVRSSRRVSGGSTTFAADALRGERALIQLGSSAYWTIGAEPFEELAAKFEGVVYALARLGADATLRDMPGPLRLYDLWERTESPHAARALARHGIKPAAGSLPRPDGRGVLLCGIM